jgi:hypothetical protein
MHEMEAVFMTKEDIILRKSIVHILDSTLGIPVLSDEVLDTGIDLSEFIRTHIARLLSGDDLKRCYFQEESSGVYEMLKNYDEENFIPFTKELSARLYTIMNENPAIPPADFLISSFQWEGGQYLALLKMNYRDTYVHLTGRTEMEERLDLQGNKEESVSEEETLSEDVILSETKNDSLSPTGNYNRIMKQTATLPSSGSRLSEAVIIDLSDLSIQLVEKKYEINGVKENYLSTRFLECGTKLSQKTKMNIVARAVEQINEKYFDQDLNKKMETKSVIQKEIEEEGSLQVEKAAEILYSEIPEIKEEFMEKMEKYHMDKEEIKPQNPATTKKFTKQFLTTDTGIEINIPTELYDDVRNVEFITNADGTISILIKNINHIQAK